ncbi:hypothetical protein EYR38_002418 [Pleurotus pulmonarius]|nr:hypothetical protein EYR38_002418 [Pleurotus pulmonarius]
MVSTASTTELFCHTSTHISHRSSYPQPPRATLYNPSNHPRAWSSPTESAFSYEWLDTHVKKQGDAQDASNQLRYHDTINLQALQDAYLNFGGEDDTSASTPASSTPTSSTTPTTPASEDSSLSLVHNATAVDATEELSIPDAITHFPATLDVSSSATPAHEVPQVLLSASPPSDVINAHALRALLQASASASANTAAEQTPYAHPPYVQQQGARFFDPSLAPWLSPPPLLLQNHAQSGNWVLQGYPAVTPPSYTPMGRPTLNQYGPPVPQPPYQYGGYYNYFANAGAVPKSAVPVFPAFSVQPSFKQPGASLGSAKPLSASGRPNEPAGPSQSVTALVSSKRKSILSHAKGKARGKAKEVVENADHATSAERTLVDEEDVAPSSKKPRRASSASPSTSTRATHPRTASTNLKYTQVGTNKYRCSGCAREDLTRAQTRKHREFCGRADPSRTCALCGTVIKGGRKSSVTRHQKSNLCKSGRGAYAARTAAGHAGPGGVVQCAGSGGIAAMAGTQFVFAFSGAIQGTQGPSGAGADEGDGDGDGDGDGYSESGDDEHDEYVNAARASSVTLEDVRNPGKKGKAAKN